MARFTVELPIIGVQQTNVDGKVYAKVFVAEQPDGQTEQIASIMTMPIKEEFQAEVFAAAASFQLGETIRLHVDTARGGKQSVRNEVFHVEPLTPTKPQQQQPAKASA